MQARKVTWFGPKKLVYIHKEVGLHLSVGIGRANKEASLSLRVVLRGVHMLYEAMPGSGATAGVACGNLTVMRLEVSLHISPDIGMCLFANRFTLCSVNV